MYKSPSLPTPSTKPPPSPPTHNTHTYLHTHTLSNRRLLVCGENVLRAEHSPGYWGIFLEEVYEGPQV